jgi:hypothetical protein
MTFDIFYQTVGSDRADGFITTVKTEKAARRIAADLSRFPANTLHIFVTCDDGRTIIDTSKLS